jgi:hypothetical protein
MGWALRVGMAITIVGAFAGGLMTSPTEAQLAEARATQRLTLAGAHTSEWARRQPRTTGHRMEYTPR